jgi:hypothetical protein
MVIRAALFASLVLALWTFGRSAFAMPAGLCDDRGASAIAPPPSFEAPDVAIQRAHAPFSCAGRKLPPYARILPTHRILSPPVASPDCALPATARSLAVPWVMKLDLDRRSKRPPAGISWRVERPPRA